MTPPAYLSPWRPAATLERPRGVFRFYRPVPGVVLTFVTGHVDEDAAQCFARNASAAVAGGRRHRVLHDWEHLTGYEPSARQVLVRWALGNVGSIESVHALIVNSKLVAMGWAAASLVLGPVGMSLRAEQSREAFERLVADSVRQAQAASAPGEGGRTP